MKQRIIIVDAFTSEPFKGNPAAVCVMDRAADAAWMQNVASEMNLAETAFLYPTDREFHLRWFSPAVEIALCGHATVASAHVLWQYGHLADRTQARFRTMSGLLTADQEAEWIKLDFPAQVASEVVPPSGLLDALGLDSTRFVGRSAFDFLIEVESEDVVRSVKPDMGKLAQVAARGAIVTSRSASQEFDFVSRFFAPAVGVPEDPVTGSAHCCLTPYWAERLGKSDLMAYQASPRGGVLKLALRGDRVWLFGKAVTVVEGSLLV